jgi:uncharacterized membrane protein YheB (UPF0754 family)
MNAWLFLIPLISAFIGWITNRIAIKMLFHPLNPKKIFGITLQGVIPKHQKSMAQQIGSYMSRELFSFDAIEQKITSKENISRLMPVIELHIDEFLRNKLKVVFPMVGMFVGEKTITQFKSVFMAELETIFPPVMTKYVQDLKEQFDIEKIVVARISGIAAEHLEAILYQNLSRELRLLSFCCTLLGFLIGILQLLIVIFLI